MQWDTVYQILNTISSHRFKGKLDKFMEDKSTETKSPQYHVFTPGLGNLLPANC